MKKPRSKCKVCKEYFERTSNKIVPTCHKYECRKTYAIEYHQKQKEKQSKQKVKDKEGIAKTKQEDTLKDRLKDLGLAINHISRLIDKDCQCMMCGAPKVVMECGCHFHSKGADEALRFNLFNLHRGCNSCNGFKGGEMLKYYLKLGEVYGEERRDYIQYTLKADYQRKNINLVLLPFVKESLAEARKIIRELKSSNQSYPVELRWKLREKYNERISIYLKDVPV